MIDLPFYFNIILISLLSSAFFSGMEIAYVTANRFRVELDKKQGRFSSKIISYFTHRKSLFIATMLLGNNVALVIYGLFTAKILEPVIQIYVTESQTAVLLIQTLLSTIVILVTAEFLPKTLFRLNPYRVLNLFAVPLLIFFFLFYPITILSVYISEKLLKSVFKAKISSLKENKAPNVFGKTDLDNFLIDGESNLTQGSELENDIKIFKNALEFSEIKLREVMVPRNEVEAIEINSGIAELQKKFIETGYSKLPVYKNSIDNIVGYIHSHEMFKSPVSVESAMSSIIIAPETMPANKLLSQLIRNRKHIALVVDEFGGTSGIVTTEDIMEEIFGEIEDEFDTDELTEKKISDEEYIFSGRLEIDYINEKYDLELKKSFEYETLAGYIFHIHEKIPAPGELISDERLNFEILKTDGPKIETVKLTIRKSSGR